MWAVFRQIDVWRQDAPWIKCSREFPTEAQADRYCASLPTDWRLEVREVPDGIELQLEVAAACAWRLKERRRTLAGLTGCGLCGAESLGQVRRELPRVAALDLTPQALARGQRELQRSQAMQKLTGATHAAAWCAVDGQVLLVREDVGRHIALDKLVGAMVRSAANPAEGFICVTSRASFEMVQKTAMAGVATLAAVSAPTALAVDVARSCGLALAGFVRGDALVAYTFAERLGLCEVPLTEERS